MDDAADAYEPGVAKIVRLGHVVLGTNTYEQTERYFADALNYRVSDRIDGAVTFMRCFPNPLHHSFGLSNADVNRLHHVNFMVTDIDDIGKAIYRARKLDVPVVFGPGRHPPSESVFFYFLDPDGLTLEYSFGMEEFPETHAREPRRLPHALESIDYWGAIPDARFGNTGAIERLAV
jgi:2,3-dihydroxy-p-cumate/2,3-dihydroxybenzoate 3,4-dioxygenase